jgi:membrane protease YdiL (CAAX protease family)
MFHTILLIAVIMLRNMISKRHILTHYILLGIELIPCIHLAIYTNSILPYFLLLKNVWHNAITYTNNKPLIMMADKLFCIIVPTMAILFGYDIAAGQIDYMMVALSLVIIVTTYFILHKWFQYAKTTYKGVGNMISQHLNKLNEFEQMETIMMGCMGNAMAEELIFRGVFANELIKLAGLNGGIMLQSLIFGFAHFRYGFPNGLLGASLACIFGLFMGILYVQTGGIIMPIIIHTIVDIMIFKIVL